eukprot:SM002596S08659  [mRNA]  locus=s2596:150:1717:+ [translate_table: standard]
MYVPLIRISWDTPISWGRLRVPPGTWARQPALTGAGDAADSPATAVKLDFDEAEPTNVGNDGVVAKAEAVAAPLVGTGREDALLVVLREMLRLEARLPAEAMRRSWTLHQKAWSSVLVARVDEFRTALLLDSAGRMPDASWRREAAAAAAADDSSRQLAALWRRLRNDVGAWMALRPQRGTRYALPSPALALALKPETAADGIEGGAASTSTALVARLRELCPYLPVAAMAPAA